MAASTIQDPARASLPSLTEETFARWQAERGVRVFAHRGRWWKQTRRGFYEPVHWMARLTADEATAPARLRWGYRATLREELAGTANGSIPLFWLPNLASYDEGSLTSNRRNQLRRCRKRVQLVQLTGLDLLREQGHQVLASSLARTAYRAVPTRQEYVREMAADVHRGRRLVLAGLIDGRLGGYLIGSAVDGTAYLDDVAIATEALSSYIGIGLHFEFAQACRRSGITMLVHGLHSREDGPLCTFKEGIGFAVKQVPATVHIHPLMRRFLRRRYPDKYYRLTGSPGPPAARDVCAS
jgi:hypothetical protein